MDSLRNRKSTLSTFFVKKSWALVIYHETEKPTSFLSGRWQVMLENESAVKCLKGKVHFAFSFGRWNCYARKCISVPILCLLRIRFSIIISRLISKANIVRLRCVLFSPCVDGGNYTIRNLIYRFTHYPLTQFSFQWPKLS
jgi:hypothetical protein